MRPIWSLLTVLAVPALVSAATITGPFVNLGNQTLVPNGDFTSPTALSGWFTAGAGGSFSQTPTVGPDGLPGTALGMTGPGGIGVNVAGYAVGESDGNSFVPGNTYVLSGFIEYLPGATGNAYVDLNDVPEDPNVLANPNVIGQWQFVYADFVAGSTNETVRIVRDSGDSPNDQVLFDNIAITPVAAFVAPTAVPSPSAAWSGVALIAGFGALQTLRRRASSAR